MLKRTPINVIFIVLATVAFIFAATHSYSCDCSGGSTQICSECTPDRAGRGECFQYYDSGAKEAFTVEIIPDENGNFPKVVGGNTVFEYRICQPGPSVPGAYTLKNIDLIDIKVPETCGLSPLLPLPAQQYWITDEAGEPLGKFAQNDPDYDVYKWNLSNFCYGTISFTMAGNVYAAPQQMLLKVGYNPFPVGKILGPTCVTPPPVADAKKTLSFDNINLELTFDPNTGQLFSALAFPQGSTEAVEGGAVVTDIKTSQIYMCFPPDEEGGPYCFPLDLQWASNDCRIKGHGSGTCTTTTTYVMGNPYLVTTCTCTVKEDCPAGSGYKSCRNGICSTRR